MKKTLVIVIDLVIMGLILFFIIQYANTKMRESNESVIEAFEKMTVSAEQIITNYLEDEQHLCDIWSNYINRSAEAGTPMTAEEAISFIRKAKISPIIYGHLILLDESSKSGISTHPSLSNPDDYSVSYRKVQLFDSLDEISKKDGVVNLTRAYTNPQNGIQSIAFMNIVNILDENTGELKEALLMRVEPVSALEDKLVFLNGEYESVEISLINKDGDYLVHGKSMKNSNFFEYYKSYNKVNIDDYNRMTSQLTSESGTMRMSNSKGEECVISYTPLKSMDTWFLLAYIPAWELANNTVVDWLLLGMVTIGLLSLLVFNYLVLMLYNRKLAEAAQMATQANEAKSHFLSTMSHDIRTPMNAILGLNEMVLRDSHEEEIVAYSESIRTAGKTLLGIINDILDFSKIEAGKMDIINVDYSFISMLNDLVNMVQGKAEDKGLAFNLDVDRNIPTILHGDEIRIKQIIINILSNAVKYTKKGSITFKAYFAKETADSIRLIISVTDTGIGIKPEDMDRLFTAFERIDENKNRNIEGTGLGMSIAQSFLNMMGSHIEVESKYGEGSTFSFELVQRVKDWMPIGDYEERFKRSVLERVRYRESFCAPNARLLVVDDSTVNLSVFKSLLKRTRVQIDAATSGDEGISLFKKNHYDVIFLDHMMPDKDGIETLKEMKGLTDTLNDNTPIVCLTANAISGMREMYINAGFDDYVTKPIDPERLEMLLLHYLPKEKLVAISEGDDADDSTIPDFICKIEDIDVNAGLIHCGSNEAYIDTLMNYLDSAETNADEIEKYWQARDLKNTAIKIHALKSTSRVIGAEKLGDFAAKLEKASEAGDLNTLESQIEQLLADYRTLAGALSPLKETKDDYDDNSLPLISEQDMKAAYASLAECCESFDYDSLAIIIESFEKYSFPENEKSRVKALKKAIDNFDYDLIPQILTGGQDYEV
ncbi:Signal transduction histidine kinase [Pseudobutyrivibrio sp. ACV-2]|uniref:ATP-binding protein n=1 Tax=Pseudobutyrivibrio sp. ACV-2 TaxID=1520801 RepID=UPI000896A168|nr:ATP-binding protein [Pseudobutyrivibrio sp. ACV-2]SEA63483.1 Signal transduction histidine kinase [Pseudobutyrivibrio sp. ACV-2]